MNSEIESGVDLGVTHPPVPDAVAVSELLCRVFTDQVLSDGDRRLITNSLLGDRRAMIAMRVEALIKSGLGKSELTGGAYGAAAEIFDCSASTARLAHKKYYCEWSSFKER